MNRRSGRRWPLATVFLVWAAAAPLGAQVLEPAVSMGGGIASFTPAAAGGALLIAPRFDYALGGFTAMLDGRFASSGPDHRTSDLTAAAAFRNAAAAPLGLQAALRARALHFATLDLHGEALASLTGEYRRGTTGFFLRGETGIAGRARDVGSLLRVGAGVRSRTGPRRVELSVSTTRFIARVAAPGAPGLQDTILVRDSLQGPRRSWLYMQTELRLDWRGADWSMGLDAGGRVRSDNGATEGWGQVHARKRITAGLDVIAAAGWAAAAPELRLAARPVADLSLRFTPTVLFHAEPEPRHGTAVGRTTSILDLGKGHRLLRIPASGARRVEIIADFTDWQVRPLQRGRDGFWVLPLDLSPGRYCINVRYDGGPWTVPPGLVTTHDEFDGLTGVLLID